MLHELLYHYTSLAGLRGIISSQQLWASSIHHMSDWREFSYGLGHAGRYIRSLMVPPRQDRRWDLSDEAVQAVTEWAIKFEAVEEIVDGLANSLIFVFCLSEEDDLLSQWRAYGQPNAGYAIGFSTEILQRVVGPQGFHLSECEYDRSRQERDVKVAVDDVVGHTLEQEGPRTKCDEDEHVERFKQVLTWKAAAMKDERFQEEKEWRLVSDPINLPNDRVVFHAGDSMLIPRYTIDLNKGDHGPIRSVVIGPTPHPEHAMAAVKWLLEQHGIDAEVRHSTIPFRAW